GHEQGRCLARRPATTTAASHLERRSRSSRNRRRSCGDPIDRYSRPLAAKAARRTDIVGIDTLLDHLLDGISQPHVVTVPAVFPLLRPPLSPDVPAPALLGHLKLECQRLPP